MKQKVTVVEVGLRDGLQNETKILSQNFRLQFAEKLVQCGLKRIELGSFVSPRWVPQMKGTGQLFRKIQKIEKKRRWQDVEFSALVPNLRGMQDAHLSDVRHVAVFTSSTEGFSQRNLNCSIQESLEKSAAVIEYAKVHNIKVRGYVSMCFGCPYEGWVKPAKVVRLSEKLLRLGVHEVSIGDTIGVAHPKQVKTLLRTLTRSIPKGRIAMHFHDTRGLALANVAASLENDIHIFDSSLAGLGGCPYAENASGNLATEDLIYFLNGYGIKTGIYLKKLIELSHWVRERMGKPLPGHIARAGLKVGRLKLESSS